MTPNSSSEQERERAGASQKQQHVSHKRNRRGGFGLDLDHLNGTWEPRGVPEITDEEVELGCTPFGDRVGSEGASQVLATWSNRWRGLDEAVLVSEDGWPVLLVPVGGELLIERYSSVLRGAWMDTRLYTVQAYEDPMQGDVLLWDKEYQQHAWTNVISGFARGLARFFMQP